jgi:hypothetical protein
MRNMDQEILVHKRKVGRKCELWERGSYCRNLENDVVIIMLTQLPDGNCLHQCVDWTEDSYRTYVLLITDEVKKNVIKINLVL